MLNKYIYNMKISNFFISMIVEIGPNFPYVLGKHTTTEIHILSFQIFCFISYITLWEIYKCRD